jgi:hypothetical protein
MGFAVVNQYKTRWVLAAAAKVVGGLELSPAAEEGPQVE